MSSREAIILEDCLYEDFLLVFHQNGFTTFMHSVNECYVFSVSLHTTSLWAPPEFDHKYLGNFKVQGSEIHLYKEGERAKEQILQELADPELYQNVLRYFGKQEREIESYFNNRRHRENLLSAPKMSENGV